MSTPCGTRIAVGLLLLSISCTTCSSRDRSPVCAPSLEDYSLDVYREPSVAPAPFVQLDATRPGWHLQVNFPDAANAGSPRLSYWLTGDERLEVDVQLAIGPRREAFEPRTVLGGFLLDAEQRDFSIDGAAAARISRHRIERVGEVLRFQISIAAAQVPAGAHTATLLFLTEVGERFPSWGFTVLKDGTGFPPWDNAPEVKLVPRKDAADLRVAGNGAWVDESVRPDETGTLDLMIGLQTSFEGCATAHGFAAIALLDGVQIPVGGFGTRPRVELPFDRRAELRATFAGLPMDGKPHVLAIYMLADGQYREAPRGKYSPWSEPPARLGKVGW